MSAQKKLSFPLEYFITAVISGRKKMVTLRLRLHTTLPQGLAGDAMRCNITYVTYVIYVSYVSYMPY